MITIRELLGQRRVAGDLALEIEVEALRELPQINNERWISKAEGSLRNFGIEYVTNGAMPVGDLDLALRPLLQQINHPSYQVVQDNPRSSVHVHLNVQELSPTQYWNVVVAWWLLENPLLQFCGADRCNNHFCLRLKDAEGIIKTVVMSLKSDHPFYHLINERTKYAAINVGVTGRYGSLEIRSMRGTTDQELIKTWATQCHDLKGRAARFSNPPDVVESFFGNKDDFMDQMLQPELAAWIRRNCPNYQDMMEENLGPVCEVAYCHDWTRWQERLNKRKKKSVFDEMAVPEIPMEQPAVRPRVRNNALEQVNFNIMAQNHVARAEREAAEAIRQGWREVDEGR